MHGPTKKPGQAPASLILICEDEIDVAELIEYNLRREGFFSHIVCSGSKVHDKAKELNPRLILLDILLPEMKGMEVCRRLRADPQTASIPVIIVSALNSESDRIVGLEMGADDYVTKPFSPKELVARVRAVLRRVDGLEKKKQGLLESQGVSVDAKSHRAFVEGHEIHLTLTEFKLLRQFLAEPGEVITRERLLKLLPGEEEEYSSRVIDVHLVALRKKMGASGDLIETIRGVGYRFKE